jgi:hypothetical protein
MPPPARRDIDFAIRGKDDIAMRLLPLVRSGENCLAILVSSGDGGNLRSAWWAFPKCMVTSLQPFADRQVTANSWYSFTLSFETIEHHTGDYQPANPSRPSGIAAVGAATHGAVAAIRNLAAKIAKTKVR